MHMHWHCAPTLSIGHAPPRKRGKGTTASTKEGLRVQVLRRQMGGGREWLFAVAMMIDGGVEVCLGLYFMTCSVKK